MTQFYAVLRRSMAHLPADDPEARARAFASAREAMVRLLWSYDPPLTRDEIDARLGDFDSAVDRIEIEIASGGLEPAFAEQDAETAAPAPAGARPGDDGGLPAAWHDDPAPFEAGTVWRADQGRDRFATETEVAWGRMEPEEAGDEEEEEEDGDGEAGPRGAAHPERDGGVGRGSGFLARFGGDVAARSPSTLLAGVGATLVILGLVWCVWFVSSLIEQAGAPQLADPNALPALPEEKVVAPAKPTVQELVDDGATQVSVAAVDAPAGDAPEGTIVLFDGRDPTVFQSAPANPVRFDGGPDQGFVRISTSTSSTGTRLNVGRGAFERLAGQTIRLIVVARGSPDRPSGSFRFTYQNGRTVGPWIIGRPDAEWQTFSATWAVPPDRGAGPENDLLLIEPGVPGDGTAIDVRGVRIEIIGKTPEDDPVSPPAETSGPTETPL